MKYTIALLFLLSNLISAQTKGVVKDSISGKPIPYVNIWVQSENIGVSSEENGEFIINAIPKNQHLIFSSLGYETKKTLLSEAKTVILKPIVYQLDDVVISKPKQTKQIEIGDFKNAIYLPEPQYIPWIFAKKIDINKENPDSRFIKNITFYTHSEVDKAVFRVRIFSVNQQNMPGDDVLTEEVIVTTKKGKNKIIVELLKNKIEIPNEGIIVGFESLFLEQNKYIQKTSKKGVTFVNYDPHILYQYQKKEESYAYRTGFWTKQTFEKYYQDEEGKRVISPAIKVTLTN